MGDKSEVGSTRRSRPLTEKEAETARVEEEKAYNLKTGADFGFKRMNGSPNWLKGILPTNATDIYTPNCQRCVVAFEARMRGYDVIARPSWGDDDSLRSSGAWIKAFNFSYNDFKICNGKTADDVVESIKELMYSFGEGARAIIIFKWNKSYGFDGHAIVAQYNKGIVNIGDPQTGERAAAYKLNKADLKSDVLLLRVDNLQFTDMVKRCCMNRE